MAVVGTANTSATVANLALDGSAVYVTLWTLTAGGQWLSNAYTYTAATVSSAAMLSPLAGTTLTGGAATFTWSAVTGAQGYQLWIGSAPRPMTWVWQAPTVSRR